MVFGINCNWIKLPFLHQEVRAFLVDHQFAQDNEIDFETYLTSHDHLFHSLSVLRRVSFEEDYRRRSMDFKLELDSNARVLAYAQPNTPDTAYVSRGLLIAIEDACQSIVSDIRSKFALNTDDWAMQEAGLAPNVAWSPQISDIFDSFRYVDYNLALDFAKQKKRLPVGLLHKFVSVSTFRQQLADLLSAFSILWISAHEDAHFYLGHIDYFNNNLRGLPDPKNDYFQEFISQYKNPENKQHRLAAEFAADSNASMALADQICWDEMFDINSFLYKYLHYVDPSNADDEEALRCTKTIYMFRLAVVAATIALAVFERNTIKNSANAETHPSLAMRILNIVQQISGRIVVISHLHPDRGLHILSNREWLEAFLAVQKDIEVILLYIFEQGFVLSDDKIRIRTVNEALEFDLSQKLFAEFITFLICLAKNPDAIDALPFSKSEQLKRYFSQLEFSNRIGTTVFLPSRLKVNNHRIAKVEESLEFELQHADKLKFMLSKLK